MKIEGNKGLLQQPQTGESRNRPAAQPAPATSGKSGATTVALSPMSSSLARAEAAMESTPAVNQARVDEIRQAIQEGRFKVDANRIADGLLDSVREMLGHAGKA